MKPIPRSLALRPRRRQAKTTKNSAAPDSEQGEPGPSVAYQDIMGQIITRPTAPGQLGHSEFPAPSASVENLDPTEPARLRTILTRNHNGDQALMGLSDDGVPARCAWRPW